MRCSIDAVALHQAVLLSALILPTAVFAADAPALHHGYYSTPAIHGNTVVFTSEGDLWTVDTGGGIAHRLTSDPGRETNATISPDGKTVAFSASYEGPTEVYTMPIDGGLPQRRSWDGDAQPVGWAPDGRLMISTARYSTLPESQIVFVDERGAREILPLAQAFEAAWSTDKKTLFFTRWPRQWSETKRYKGGWNESIWRYDGSGEAVPLTADWPGTSTQPMFWNGRVYFLSDRDGIINVYSMDRDGHDLKEESHQHIFGIESASIDDGRIVYACGSDLWLLDLKSGREQIIPVTLASDFDQMREHWVKKPLDYLTAAHISADGSRIVFTARGEIFTMPAKTGRIIKVAADSSIRFREARFMPDGKSIVALSTASGETDFWQFPANGVGAPTQVTNDAHVLRWEGVPSPDGRWLAHRDKDQQLWIYDLKAKIDKRIAQSMEGDFNDLSWSPDSRWLAYVETAADQFDQIKVLNVESGVIQALTSDRYDNDKPVWSSDGKRLYFLSDRMLKTSIRSPWGPREPEPHFDHSVKIYELALVPGLRSPFLPADELHPDTPPKKDDEKKASDDKPAKPSDDKKDASNKTTDEKKDEKTAENKPPEVKIDFTDLASRLTEVPVPPGNYDLLQATDKRLCWLNASDDTREHRSLQCFDIANKGDEVDTVLPEVKNYEISLDRKQMMVQKGDDFYVLDGDAKGASLADPKALPKLAVNLSHWTMSTTPRAEFRGIFLDAWRLERDYFYDRNMHGVDWVAMRERYLPLVDRVADRDELNEVIAQMVGELSALHTFVVGGDDRKPADQIDLATLGARLHRDEKAGGYVVEHIYQHDPDLPNLAPPLARPDSLVKEGETIVSIDGKDLLSISDERDLLRGKTGTQVLLHVRSAKGEFRDVLVTPISADDDAKMRYREWEYSRRLLVDSGSDQKIGYVHLQAMGPDDIDQWAREFYPVFNRQGLIIDV
ncbi:MAG TPA: PDZ domain-containing protein, partial [Terracidiphilus sp.]|nr:PDZ domain-containing protein [Terracidiphilus sp.]